MAECTRSEAPVGAWQPAHGTIGLERAASGQWFPEALSRHIEYLPQDAELFDGTGANNISRLEEDAEVEFLPGIRGHGGDQFSNAAWRRPAIIEKC